MAKMIIGIDESTLFYVAAVGMAVVLLVALFKRRLPADPLPFLIVTVIPFVLMAEIARDYPLRLRYLLPLAVVIAIEAAVAFAYIGGAINRRFPGLRPYVACGFVVIAAYGVVFTVSRAPQVHTPVLPFVNGGVQILDTYKLDCNHIGFLAGRVRDVKVIRRWRCTPTSRCSASVSRRATPCRPTSTCWSCRASSRSCPIRASTRSRRSTGGLFYGTGKGCSAGLGARDRRSGRDVRRLARRGAGSRDRPARGDDARHRHARRRAPSARVVLMKGHDAGRLRLVHRPAQPQGCRTGREPARGAGVRLARPGPPGASGGRRGADRRGSDVGLLPDAPARVAHRRLGLAPVGRDRLAGRARGAGGRRGGALRRRRSTVAAALDGLPPAPERYEFWTHDEARLHDRVVYRRTADGWARELLSP